MSEEQKEEAPKKGKGKLIVIILAAVLALGGGGAAAWYFLLKKPADAAAQLAAEQSNDDGHDKDGKKDKKGKNKRKAGGDGAHTSRTFVPLDQFVVNLHDAHMDRYAQVAVVLEVDDAHVEAEIKTAMPAIRNAVLLLISSRSAENLLSLAGKEQLAIDIAIATYAVLEGEQPPRPHPSEAAAAEPGAAKTAPASRTFDDVDTGPISAVHFSQFIVQ